jgi:hypothetical protein
MNQFKTEHVKPINTASTGPMNQLGKGEVVQSMALLPAGFVPGDDDVICGRGRNCFNHSGNVRFRAIVTGYLDQYSKSTSKMEKSFILSDIVAKVRKSSPNGGGFVKKCPETKRFYEIGCFLAREKTSQAFRDALHDQYKSSNSAKKKRRQVTQAAELQKAYSASNLGYDAAAEPLDAYAPSSSKFMRVDRPMDLLQRAHSASNIGYDAAAAEEPLIGSMDISEFGSRTVRRGLSSQSLVSRGSSWNSILEFERVRECNRSGTEVKAGERVREFSRSGTEVKAGAWFNRSCPNLSVKNKSYEESGGPSENLEWESDSKKSFSEQYQSSSRIANNPFLDSKPYFSRSSQSLMSVEESIAEGQEESEGLDKPTVHEERELTMESLFLKAANLSKGSDLLSSLSTLIDDLDMEGDPFEPVPLPKM